MLAVKPVVRPLFLTLWLIAAATGVFEIVPTSRIRPCLSTMPGPPARPSNPRCSLGASSFLPSGDGLRAGRDAAHVD